MKQRMVPTIVFLLLVAGCAQKHSYHLEGETLTLLYKNSNAKEIFFASSLDNYSYHSAKKIKNNIWKISIPAADEFKYFYIVDGMITLPDCRYTEQDDFGSKNCLFVYEM